MKHIVFLTGAGISVESGLSTFRGKDGLWAKQEFEYLASLECLDHEAQRSLDFYNMRREQLATVEPNSAHRMIAELEKYFKVSIITQNVDNQTSYGRTIMILVLHMFSAVRTKITLRLDNVFSTILWPKRLASANYSTQINGQISSGRSLS